MSASKIQTSPAPTFDKSNCSKPILFTPTNPRADAHPMSPRSENLSAPCRVLFVCGKNRLRSPTAEQVFATWPGIETASAGVSRDADVPVTPELLRWADILFVMERRHRARLSEKFRPHLSQTRIVCLDIPDRFDFMEPALVRLLETRVPRHLPKRTPAT